MLDPSDFEHICCSVLGLNNESSCFLSQGHDEYDWDDDKGLQWAVTLDHETMIVYTWCVQD